MLVYFIKVKVEVIGVLICMYIYVDFKIDVDYDEKGDCLFFFN